MDRIIDAIMSVWDYPVFQHISGIAVGAAVIGALWAICTAYRYSKEIKRLEAENSLDLTTVTMDRPTVRVFVNGKELQAVEDTEDDENEEETE